MAEFRTVGLDGGTCRVSAKGRWVLGLNVDPANIPHGAPEPSWLRSEGFEWVRLVHRPSTETYRLRAQAAGMKVLCVLARESFDAAPFDYYLERYREKRPSAVQLGNEPDQSGEASWTMEPSVYKRFADCHGAPLRRMGITTVGAGLASGNPDWLYAAGWPITGLDAIAVHPYAKNTNEARWLLQEYWRFGQQAVWVTEWNRPAKEIGDFQRMLDEETKASMWFCWSDGMVDGFGLVDVNGGGKPEYYALQEVRTMGSVDDAQAEAYSLANPEVVFNRDAAITKKWLSLKADGVYIGVPVGPEMDAGNGHRAQAFTSGAVLVWRGGDQVDVL